MKLFSNLKEKYNNMSLPFRATIWFAFCQILQKGISVLTTPFFTRLLSTEQYGLVSTFNSWESIFSILIMFSTYKCLLNLCTKYENQEEILAGITGLNLTLSIVWIVIFGVFRVELAQIMGMSVTLVLCLLFLCLSQNFIICWTVVNQYSYKYKKVVCVTLLYTLVSVAGGLISVAFYRSSAEAKIVPQTVCSLLIGLILLIVIFKRGKIFFNKSYWKFALLFSIPLLPHYLSEIILQSSDRIMINSMCGTSEVAIYSLAYTVGSAIGLVTGAINSAFAPYQYQKIKSQEYDDLAKNTNYIIAFIAGCLCLIMLFGREIVLILGGSKYLDSINLIIPICLGAFFNYIFQLFARVQEYFEQKITIVIASVFCAGLNICLNYFGIKKFGYSAAAYTTFICYFVFCFIHYLFYKIACKRNIHREIYNIKGLIIISALLIIFSALIWFINDYFYIKYIILALVIIVTILKRKTITIFLKKSLFRSGKTEMKEESGKQQESIAEESTDGQQFEEIIADDQANEKNQNR